MQPKHTQGIVLTRTNYGESDRIVTLLTRDFGKVRVMARGVRKERSKLAGGIELFSVSDIGFVLGRGELATLVSSRLIKHFDGFLSDLTKVDFAYACLKSINKITADAADEQYFLLLQELFKVLNEPESSLAIVNIWWYAQLLQLTGHNINLGNQTDGKAFADGQNYIFDPDHGGFIVNNNGTLKPEHIKFLRIAISHGPQTLTKVQGGQELANDLLPFIRSFIEFVQ
jgi:DNA repair protein RecO (recombination protein O)